MPQYWLGLTDQNLQAKRFYYSFFRAVSCNKSEIYIVEMYLVQFTTIDLLVTFVFALVLRNMKRIIFKKESYFKSFDSVAQYL